jgi:uncharacterized membrane protein
MGKLVGIAALALAAILLLVSVSLLPSTTEATEKGTFAPLVLTWIMIGTVLLSAFALAGHFLRRGDDRSRR